MLPVIPYHCKLTMCVLLRIIAASWLFYVTAAQRSAKAYGPASPYQPAYQNDTGYGGYPKPDCGLPTVASPLNSIPEQQHGVHYGYLVWPQKFVQTNQYYTADRIGKTRTLFPGTNIEAEAQRLQQYNDVCNPYTQQCTCHALYGLFSQAVDGKFSGSLYDSDTPNEMAPDMGFYLYDDPDTVEIYYECYYASITTRKCADAGIFVNTRKRPDQLSPQERARIDQIVESVVSRYCFSRGQLYEHVWIPRPLCTGPAPSACFVGAVEGVEKSIDNGRFVTGLLHADVEVMVGK